MELPVLILTGTIRCPHCKKDHNFDDTKIIIGDTITVRKTTKKVVKKDLVES